MYNYNRDVLHMSLSNIEVTTSPMSRAFICINFLFNHNILNVFGVTSNLVVLIKFTKTVLLVTAKTGQDKGVL